MLHPFFAHTLLSWYARNGRALPWRQSRDAYRVWLSEIILQQTRVEQGWPYWERFVAQWPTVELLAEASEDEVLRQWQGLGYYSRGRNLLRAARQVVAMGGFPRTARELKALAGVGPYTAAAIASICFDEPVAVVDGNVLRVVARVFGIDTPVNTTEGGRLIATMAQELLPPGEAAAYNQAIMDFGAMQCTPAPHCDSCPLSDRCDALLTGRTTTLPRKTPRRKPTERHLSYLLLVHRGRLAMHRRGEGDIWQGLWEPLLVADDGGQPSASELEAMAQGAPVVKEGVRHVLTHRVLIASCRALTAAATDPAPALPDGCQWVDIGRIDSLGKPRLVEKLLAAAGAMLSI